MTTLRRELRKIAEGILKVRVEEILYDQRSGLYTLDIDKFISDLAEELLDSLNSKPKIDLSKTDPAWAILAGEQVDTTDSILVYDAKNAFERDMKFGTLPWSSTKAWERMEKHVVEEYKKDNLIFSKYKTWQQNEGKFQAMSNRKIKERPEDFIACWPDFLAHSAMSAPKTTGNRDGWELDDHGAPISY